MSVVDWKYRLLRGGVDLMRWSRDLAMIAGIRTYGLLTRREGDDGRAEWGTLTADLSSDGDGCLVVSPCLVVTDGTDALAVTHQGGEAVLTGSVPVRLATNAGALVIEDAASGGDVTLSCAGDVTVDADGTSIALASSGYAWTLTQGAQSLAWGGVLADSTWQLLSSRALNLKSAATFPVRVLAGSGSHVRVGHDGDTVGEKALTAVTAYRTSSISRSTTTLLTALSCPLRAGRVYEVEISAPYRVTGGLGSVTWGLEYAAGHHSESSWVRVGSGSGGPTSTGINDTMTFSAATSQRRSIFRGVIHTTGAGNLLFRFARAGDPDTVVIDRTVVMVCRDLGPT